ncbi:MAG: hypothetical protein M3R14_02820, partial [Acidobacteriota bacterium]|nr:hypothetical protein [Acidobacteriota bacterium]
RKLESVPVIVPPALDVEESELAARNEFLAEKETSGANDFDDFGGADETTDEIILDENDAAPGSGAEEREAKNLRRAKRRKSLLFLVVFGAGFGIFVVFISWAFGFGFFAPPSRIAVDRNQKTNNLSSSPSATSGDEKLKTALALVANDYTQTAPVISDSSTNSNASSEQDLKLSSDGKTGEQTNQNNLPSGNMIVLPDENSSVKSNSSQNQYRVAQPLSQEIINTGTSPNLLTGEVSPTSLIIQPKSNNNDGGSVADKSDGAIARSVFFGRLLDKNDADRQDSSNNSGNFSTRRSITSNETANVPAFGTLLPVRFLGAVYTLRGAGGLVRMELSRAVKKGGLSYPAGTVLVGRLRGSEYNRAFISAIGAIDPKSGKLGKFEGEILGVDGASGVSGTRKSVKSWGARFLSGLREAGGQAVNVLTTRGGRGGTIVLGGTGGLSGEMSSIIGGNSQENSFVVVRAGTEAYVLITDLPGERREDDANEIERLAGNDSQLSGINLSESEMAEIISTDDPNKIRAALLRMSPQFRALAIKAIEEGGK